MKQRILAILLSLTMMFTLVPTAMAEGSDPVAQIGETTYATLKAAFEGAKDGDTITLTDDIKVEDTLVVTMTLTLDLAEHTLSNEKDIWSDDNWSLISVRGSGNLTITGNGTFAAKENDCYAVDVQESATVTIKNGTFIGNIHAVYVFAGTANVEGGTYSVQQKYPDPAKGDEFVLNCYDANRANGTARINVTGGTFKNFNPADNKAEGEGNNFADNSLVVQKNNTVQNNDYYVGNAANEAGADLQFEAAVAGAIPIIRPLKQSMAGNHITEIMGIVNGTTNYILTKMTESGMDYAEALAKATELGYAEADPTADVEGYDAGRKIAIMASIAFNSRVTFADVYTEGITKISADDIKYAKEFGYVIKLLGVAKNTDDGIEVKVHPMLIPYNHPLATVNDAFNAVFVHGLAMDDAMFMGRGAGQMPTASAVVGDIIDVCRNIVHDSCGKIGCCCYKHLNVKNIADTSSKFFLRLEIADRSGVLANIASVLGNSGVSIAQVVQKKSKDGVAELVIITDEVKEKHFNDAMAVFKGLSAVKNIAGVIRVY